MIKCGKWRGMVENGIAWGIGAWIEMDWKIMAVEFDENMPSWLPPSPPISDSEFDLKMEDDAFDLIYEIDPMNEARLPSQIFELRRPLAEKQKQQVVLEVEPPKDFSAVYDAVQKCLQMPSQNVVAASPAYTENSFTMDDSSQDMKPVPDIADIKNVQTQLEPAPPKPVKKRRDTKNKAMDIGVTKTATPPPPIREELDYDGAEWNIIEDHALLKAVQSEMTGNVDFEKPRKNDGWLFNWEMVAMLVNKSTRFYRSARQCCIRYQMFVRPKELGHLMVADPVTKKPVKVELSSTELAHLRKGRSTTTSQYNHDCGMLTDRKHFNRFKMVKSITTRKNQTFWRGPKEARILDSLSGRVPPRHEAKLAEMEVKYGIVLDAEEISFVPEEDLIANETKKKLTAEKLNPLRGSSPVPRTSTLILRPHVVAVKPGDPLPEKPPMTIAVPPLMPPPPLVLPTPPQPARAHIVNQPQPAVSMDHSHQQQPHYQIQVGNQQQMVTSTGHVMQSHNQMQQPIQRRTTSMANVQQTHYIQQTALGAQGGSQGTNFVVVNSAQQQQNMGNASSQDGNHGGPMTSNMGGVQGGQRITQYITPQHNTQQGMRGKATGPMYTSSPQLVVQSSGRGGPQRVMRGGVPGRMFVQQAGGERQAYVMQSSHQVRVMPTAQRVGTMGGTMGQRRTGPPQPGTVASMVMPRGGGVGQMRSMPRQYQTQNGPINVMVAARNQIRQQGGTTHIVAGGTAVKRPIMTGRQLPSIGSRSDSQQTVAQVVLAPPNPNVTSSSGSTAMTSQAPPVLHVQQRQIHQSSMVSQNQPQMQSVPMSMAQNESQPQQMHQQHQQQQQHHQQHQQHQQQHHQQQQQHHQQHQQHQQHPQHHQHQQQHHITSQHAQPHPHPPQQVYVQQQQPQQQPQQQQQHQPQHQQIQHQAPPQLPPQSQAPPPSQPSQTSQSQTSQPQPPQQQ